MVKPYNKEVREMEELKELLKRNPGLHKLSYYEAQIAKCVTQLAKRSISTSKQNPSLPWYL